LADDPGCHNSSEAKRIKCGRGPDYAGGVVYRSFKLVRSPSNAAAGDYYLYDNKTYKLQYGLRQETFCFTVSAQGVYDPFH